MPFKTNKTAEEKLSIVLEGLKAESSISDLCRKHGLSQTLYYKWRDKFLQGGEKGLMNSSGGNSSSAGILNNKIFIQKNDIN
ncbi:MAG: transposase [Melioribacteraceae bacterium]|nr:transposase [Melioribacteraceae bacterium]